MTKFTSLMHSGRIAGIEEDSSSLPGLSVRKLTYTGVSLIERLTRRFSKETRMRLLVMAIGAGAASFQTLAAESVQIEMTSLDGVVAHGAVPMNDLVGYLAGRPPFASPDGVGGRVNPLGTPLQNLSLYLKSTGAGSIQLVDTPESMAHGYRVVEAQFLSSGSLFPLATAKGQLSEALQLPNATAWAENTELFFDYAGLSVDYDSPSDYWYDIESNTDHRVFRGGTAVLGRAGVSGLIPLAQYENMVVTIVTDWDTATYTSTMTADPLPVDGVLVELSGFSAPASSIDFEGYIVGEQASGVFSGAYGTFAESWTLTLTPIPEPSAGWLILYGAAMLVLRSKLLGALRSFSG